jgi:hypothetical protein
MSQGIKYTICYKQERDILLEQVKELKETVTRLRKANDILDRHLSIAEEKIRLSPFVM